MSKKFTTENAIKIQTEQLEGWRKLLKNLYLMILKSGQLKTIRLKWMVQM